jgi:hypothetical protein
MQEVLKGYLRESELRAQWQAVETAETLEARRAAAWGLGLLLLSPGLPTSELGRLPGGRQARAEQRLGAEAVDRGGRDMEVAAADRGVPDRTGCPLGSGAGTASACAHPYRRATDGLSVGGGDGVRAGQRRIGTPRRGSRQREQRVAWGAGDGPARGGAQAAARKASARPRRRSQTRLQPCR